MKILRRFLCLFGIHQVIKWKLVSEGKLTESTYAPFYPYEVVRTTKIGIYHNYVGTCKLCNLIKSRRLEWNI